MHKTKSGNLQDYCQALGQKQQNTHKRLKSGEELSKVSLWSFKHQENTEHSNGTQGSHAASMGSVPDNDLSPRGPVLPGQPWQQIATDTGR